MPLAALFPLHFQLTLPGRPPSTAPVSSKSALLALSPSARISAILTEISRDHQISNLMKTPNFRTVEELNLDVNAPAVTPTKVQIDKIVRALKKLSFTDPNETVIIKIVSAFLALGVNPQAKSSSWLARRLKNHVKAFGLVGAPAPVAAQDTSQAVAQKPAEEAVQEPATEQQETMVEPKAKATKKAAKKDTRNKCRKSGCHFVRALGPLPRYETASAVLNGTNETSFNRRSSLSR
jgi:hypothetical protein